MEKIGLLDLFSGVGGFSLGLERTGGFQTSAFCEIDSFCRKVLAKHWPNVRCYDDVRELSGKRLAADGITNIGAVSAGFPCQDISVAGKRGGITSGTRSGLWSEVARIVGEVRPNGVFLENVSNLLAGPTDKPGGWFGRVLGDLAALGYDAEWHCIPASAVGFPHGRDRVWVIAYAREIGAEGGGIKSLPRVSALPWRENVRRASEWAERSALSRSGLCRASDGIPARMDRVGALGNAVVPQIPEILGRAYMAGAS